MILNKKLATVVLFGLTLNLNAFDLGDINTNSIADIDKQLGTINTTLQSYWDKYDINTLVENTQLDNELVGCLTDGANLKDLLNNSFSIDGICSSLGGLGLNGVSSIFDNPLSKCIGLSTPSSLTNADNLLKSFCNKGTTEATEWVYDNETRQWHTQTVNVSNYTAFNPTSVFGVGTTETYVTGGFNPSGDDKPLKQRTYKNGLTTQDILGDDGGVIVRNAKMNRNSSDAQAIRSNNVATLTLKEMTAKMTDGGSTDESKIHLPTTKLDVINQENSNAELIGLSKVDLNALTDLLVQKARDKYKNLDANTLDEYYKKEKQTFMDMIKNDNEVKSYILSVKQKAVDGLDAKYNQKLFAYKDKKGYIHDTSETIAMNLRKNRDNFVFKSLVQMSEETVIKGDLAIEKRKVLQDIDEAIQNAYPLSSIFRTDIAKKEIDDLLDAVDTAIK